MKRTPTSALSSKPPKAGWGSPRFTRPALPMSDHVLRRFRSTIAAVPMRAAPPTMTHIHTGSVRSWPPNATRSAVTTRATPDHFLGLPDPRSPAS